MKTLAEYTLDKAVHYHIKNQLPIYENVFRPHSEMNYALFKEMRSLYENGLYEATDAFEKELLETDIGSFDFYEGEKVPLDFPLQEAEYDGEEVELNKPKRGGSKKFYVYVKDGDKVKKVSFGDPNMSVKFDDEGARKSFAARHQCADKKDKTKAGYWSCRLPMYAKEVGLSSGGDFFW